MASFFSPLKSLWAFKNFTNLSIFTLFAGGSAYVYIRYDNEKKFEHPVFQEAVRLAEQNNQIIDLIGFPVMLYSNARARITATDSIVNSSFTLRGPKGHIDCEIAASSLTQGEIKQELENIQKEDLTPEARQNRYNEVEEHYIPDAKLLALIDKTKVEDREKLDKTEIPKNALFWALDYFYINVDKNFRVVIWPKKTKENGEPEKDQQGVVAIDKFKPNPNRNTLEDVVSEVGLRKRKNIEEFAETEEEIEELRRFRINEQNRKLGYVRLYMFLILGAIGMSGYVYFMKNKRKSLSGTVIHHQAMEIIKRNSLVAQHLGKKLKFTNQVRGAAVGEEAEFELDAVGESKFGVFKVKGEFEKKKGDFELKEIRMVIKDSKGRELEEKKIF